MSNSSELPQQYPSASAFEPAEAALGTSALPLTPQDSEPSVNFLSLSDNGEAPVESTGILPPSYPSASPETAPAVQPVGVSRSPKGVRSSLKSLVKADIALKQPVRGVARLSQKQFSAHIAEQNRDQRIREKEEIHQILNFALRLAEAMFHCGADTIDVDSAVVSVCSVYGLDDVEVDITSQSVIINYVSDVDVVNDKTRAIGLVTPDSPGESDTAAIENERIAYTVMRVVRSWSENYAELEDIYRLIGNITQRKLSCSRAQKRLNYLVKARKPYSPLVMTLAHFMTAASLTVGIGGSAPAALISGITFSLVHQINTLIDRMKVPEFFNMLVGSLLVTLMGLYLADEQSVLAKIGVHVEAQFIVAAGMFMLLPTSRMISTVQDALTGFPLTAAGKFVSAGLSLLGIGIGLSSAVALLQVFGLGTLQIQEAIFHPLNSFKNLIFMVLASVSIGVIYYARRQALLWIVLISTCGICLTNVYVAVLGEGAGRAYAILGAVVVGMMSTYLAFKLQAPASMFYVPSLTFLLPGLSMFRGLYLFTVQGNQGAGLPSLLTAVTIIFGMAAGVVLGGFIMQYLLQKFMKSEMLETMPLTTMMMAVKKH